MILFFRGQNEPKWAKFRFFSIFFNFSTFLVIFGKFRKNFEIFFSIFLKNFDFFENFKKCQNVKITILALVFGLNRKIKSFSTCFTQKLGQKIHFWYFGNLANFDPFLPKIGQFLVKMSFCDLESSKNGQNRVNRR